MGKDKGLLPIMDSIWAKYIGAKLEMLNIAVVYSINLQQEEPYRAHIEKGQLITDLPTAMGPLKGLLSVSFQYPENDFLVVACDMPDLQQETLRLLLDAYQNGGNDFYAFQIGEIYEPLCAVYTASGLNKIYKEAEHSKLAGKSLQSLLQNGQTKKILPGNKETFNNYNSFD
jgi:molybdopterin-guanine dinucleotide biosynthesis protein A